MSNPHDALVKWAFGVPERAADELRAVLPPAFASALDWTTLHLEPGTQVDKELTERHTDLLFSVRTAGGATALLYVLLEHQSSADTLMPWRLLRYVTRIWDRWMEAHPDARKLPAIVPIVLHHGTSDWNAPIELADLIDLEPGSLDQIRAYLPSLRFLLDDLTAETDQRLMARAMNAVGRLVLLALKHGRDADVAAELAKLVTLIDEVLRAPNGAEALDTVLRYAMKVGDVTIERLRRELVPLLGARIEEVIMTAGEKLVEEGRQRGLAQGIQQGVQQGVQQGEAALLLRLVRGRFGAVSPEVEARVQVASSEQLERWSDRLLTARDLADLFDA